MFRYCVLENFNFTRDIRFSINAILTNLKQCNFNDILIIKCV